MPNRVNPDDQLRGKRVVPAANALIATLVPKGQSCIVVERLIFNKLDGTGTPTYANGIQAGGVTIHELAASGLTALGTPYATTEFIETGLVVGGPGETVVVTVLSTTITAGTMTVVYRNSANP